LHRSQACLDVAQALAKGQLCKSQTKELIEAGKATEFVIAAITCDALAELVGREVIHQLGEDDAAGVHATLSAVAKSRLDGGRESLLEVEIEKSRKGA
jgi:hypothetical protein